MRHLILPEAAPHVISTPESPGRRRSSKSSAIRRWTTCALDHDGDDDYMVMPTLVSSHSFPQPPSIIPLALISLTSSLSPVYVPDCDDY